MDVSEAPDLGLVSRLAGPSHPGCQRQGDELQMCQAMRPQGLIDFSLIAMGDPPHHEAHGVLRRPERDALKQINDLRSAVSIGVTYPS